jgi:signal transduction histidine kinase
VKRRPISGRPPLGFDTPIFDWRELKRWKISEARLPPGASIVFRDPTVLETYRWQIVGVLLGVLVQSAIITWLVVERLRRKGAQLESNRRLTEVIHLNRSATAGALSASIAHELNQPLATILTNAEAAEILVSAIPPDLDQVKEILSEIRRADRHASDIILQLRELLKRRLDVQAQLIDLNDPIVDATHILSSEARKRSVVLISHGVQRSLPVRADRVHLQQVILNLAINGMDAMVGVEPARRKLSIQAALNGASEVEVSILDTGTGIPLDKLKGVFDTFYTTKEQGTGLGLSIARTIVETYGGKIWAENRTGGGAAFRFSLPLAETAAK